MSDIIDAGRRLNRYLIENHQKPDGGFSYKPDVCWETHNTIKVADPLPQGDPVGTNWSSWCFRCVHEWEGGEKAPNIYRTFLKQTV